MDRRKSIDIIKRKLRAFSISSSQDRKKDRLNLTISREDFSRLAIYYHALHQCELILRMADCRFAGARGIQTETKRAR